MLAISAGPRSRVQSRSGVEPPTGTIHPRQFLRTTPRDGANLMRKISKYASRAGWGFNLVVAGLRLGTIRRLITDNCFLSTALAGVELSGRGFNPRPANP